MLVQSVWARTRAHTWSVPTCNRSLALPLVPRLNRVSWKVTWASGHGSPHTRQLPYAAPVRWHYAMARTNARTHARTHRRLGAIRAPHIVFALRTRLTRNWYYMNLNYGRSDVGADGTRSTTARRPHVSLVSSASHMRRASALGAPPAGWTQPERELAPTQSGPRDGVAGGRWSEIEHVWKLGNTLLNTIFCWLVRAKHVLRHAHYY